MSDQDTPPAPTPSAPATHNIRLETDRLTLRAVTLADAPDIARLAAEWEVVRYTANMPHPYTADMARAWIAGRTDDSEIVFAIVRRADGAYMGSLGYEPDLEKREAVFGYWLGQPYWGQGYASEALAAALDHVFTAHDIDRARATVVPANRASIRVLDKAGFRYLGIALEPAPARGRPVGVEVRALTRSDWQRRKAPPLPILLVAAAALVDADGRVLIARRPAGKSMVGLWEFPGGKVDQHETPESALIRELKEELAIDVREACLAPFTFASHRYRDFHLLMPLYVCRRWEGMVTPREGQETKWVMPAKLSDYPMPPADKPLVAMLRDFL